MIDRLRDKLQSGTIEILSVHEDRQLVESPYQGHETAREYTDTNIRVLTITYQEVQR